MFSKILIANRGEIAVRIIRACHEMGIATVAIFSEVDANALHVGLADERICVGKASAEKSYLHMENILSAALATGAEAIHPGYGFLSENAAFAEMCKRNGVVFIGPKSDVMEQLGDKNKARDLMTSMDVPIIPGSDIIKDTETAKREGERIGYPLLVKASAGGGGKGIRLVEREEDLESALLTASKEAFNAFGCGDVFLEKYLFPVRHVEVQILADTKGNIVSLGERDCSLQRDKQKVIEETPCSILEEDVRKNLGEVAIKAVQASNYTNAGTVEFLLDQDNNFYFIEMNTRLQVEHRISEEVTGIDIVKWQIRIASGMELPFTQEDVMSLGASIECRINAQNSGKISFLHVPGGNGVSFDTALMQDMEISPYYDAMLGKLITLGKDREEAIRKMEAALCELLVNGIETNIEDQRRLIQSAAFQKGDYHTRTLEAKED